MIALMGHSNCVAVGTVLHLAFAVLYLAEYLETGADIRVCGSPVVWLQHMSTAAKSRRGDFELCCLPSRNVESENTLTLGSARVTIYQSLCLFLVIAFFIQIY